jgi:putative transposase
VDWCRENDVRTNYIQPGCPNQNAYIERFNRSYREEVLDPYIFSTLSQVRDLSWAWLLSYNEEQSHRSLGNIPPAEFKRRAGRKLYFRTAPLTGSLRIDKLNAAK